MQIERAQAGAVDAEAAEALEERGVDVCQPPRDAPGASCADRDALERPQKKAAAREARLMCEINSMGLEQLKDKIRSVAHDRRRRLQSLS